MEDVASMCTNVLGLILGAGPRKIILWGTVFAIPTLFAISFARQWFATRRFVRSLRPVSEVPQPLADAFRKLGARRRNLAFMESSASLIFCAGLLRPRIFLSRGAFEALDGKELQAVLVHELYHARQRDPLRGAVLRALRTAFFFIPLIRCFEKRHAIGKEVAADREAVRNGGGKISLARALYKLSSSRPPRSSAISAFADQRVFEIRISALAGHPFRGVPITAAKISASIAMAGLMMALLVPPSRAEAPAQEPCTVSDSGWAILRSAPAHKTEGGYAQ